MKLYTAQQIRNWDQYTIQHEPIAPADLMERAAWACSHWLMDHLPPASSVWVMAGPGNNGGDGLAIARQLHENGFQVRCFQLESESAAASAQLMAKRLTNVGIPIQPIRAQVDFPTADWPTVIVDALFGTGLDRPLRGLAGRLVQWINGLNHPVVSIDMPSGMPADKLLEADAPIIRAQVTCTFEVPKLAMLMPEYQAHVGQMVLLPIGLSTQYAAETDSTYSLFTEKLARKAYRPREQAAHKYQFGHALLLAGSATWPGAAILAAKGALASGCGMITVSTEAGVEQLIQQSVPEVITHALQDLPPMLQAKSALALGPGWALSLLNRELLERLVSKPPAPMVLDASALRLLAQSAVQLAERPAEFPIILTPHAGEMDGLLRVGCKSTEERWQKSREFARNNRVWIILKGSHTAVISPTGDIRFNSTGNNALAKGGTGDVLTGLLTGMLASGYPVSDACSLAVWLHGLAADRWVAHAAPETFTATELAHQLGQAWRQLQAPEKHGFNGVFSTGMAG